MKARICALALSSPFWVSVLSPLNDKKVGKEPFYREYQRQLAAGTLSKSVCYDYGEEESI